jgi:DNA-binding transcriptional MocR family regulator
MSIKPDDVVVTMGCIEALNLALRAVAQAGDVIAVESPTFYGLLQVLESGYEGAGNSDQPQMASR